MAKDKTSPVDPHTRITERILADLEAGVRPWLKPWSVERLTGRVTRPLRATGEPYRGINVVLLWMEAVACGYASSTWLTYRQAQALGGQVRKGEKGAPVVYYGTSSKTRTDEQSGEEREEGFRFLKFYTVFNTEQVEGLPEGFGRSGECLPRSDIERIAEAEAWFARLPAEVRHGGDRAFYTIGEDRIQMPPFEAFDDAYGYYTTRGHETLHWTRHPSRLDRSFGRKAWGDEGYVREELCAELGAAFLAADLGLAIEPRADHAAYIGSWVQVLKNDRRAIVQAAAHAERAVAFLHTLAMPAVQQEAA